MLRDRLVAGINDQQIQHRLFAMKDPLTFDNAYKEALGLETAAKNYHMVEGLAGIDSVQ